MEQFDSAKLYAFESIELEDENYYHGMAVSYDNIGEIYYHEGLLDSATYYYAKGLELERLDENTQGISSSLMHIGKVELKKGYGKLFIKGFLLNFINIGVLLGWLGFIVLANKITTSEKPRYSGYDKRFWSCFLSRSVAVNGLFEKCRCAFSGSYD